MTDAAVSMAPAVPLSAECRTHNAFESLVAPLTPREFFLRYWGKDYFIGNGARDRFGSLFSWEALSEILSVQRFEFPRLRLLSGGRVAPPSQYIVQKLDRRGNPFITHDAKAVGRMMRHGAMLHITSIGETWKPLADFAAEMERAVGGRVQVNLHAGYAGSRGFHTHWDGHDVYAAQIDGSKTWRLFGFTEEAPLAVPPNEKHDAPTAQLWQGEIGVGDVLYLPRGYWHATQYTADPSLHLTFAVQHPNAAEFVHWVLRSLADDARIRRDMPVPLLHFPDLEASTLEQYAGTVRDLLATSLSASGVSRFAQEYRSALGNTNRVELTPRSENRHADE